MNLQCDAYSGLYLYSVVDTMPSVREQDKGLSGFLHASSMPKTMSAVFC